MNIIVVRVSSMRLYDLEIKFVDLKVWSVNIGTLRGTSGKIQKVFEQRSIDICCVQKV